MLCPACNVELRMAERQGVEIDYCPKCRGIWLDRGELDKLIERAGSQPVVQEYPPVAAQYPTPTPQGAYYRDDDDDDDNYKRQGGYDSPYQKKRKKGFLGDIFDFD